MNIHEYQAKELFDKFGVPSPNGRVASTPKEAHDAAKWLAVNNLVVKAQVHAGGRGKGVFKSGYKGGVQLVDSAEAARKVAGKMLGQVLVTKQTGEAGRLVRKVMVTESVTISREIYLAILMDRESCQPVIVASTEGGMDIEEVAERTPEKMIREYVNPLAGLQAYQVRKLCEQLGFDATARQFGRLLHSLYRLFIECDCSMVEINPVVVTTDDRIFALDAKFNFDDNGLYRHPEIAAMRDTGEEDPREVAASESGLNYIGLEGNIACLVNGAGLAMATMDIIKHCGGEPANFLDVGGGATKEQVVAAFRIILGDPQVKGILVNIFGGIMDCNVIAAGIVEATREVGLSLPLVVRLEGNNVEAGRATLAESGVAIIGADTMADAAAKIVAAVG
ncbi:MAG: ADP-forming succinate--CoA ligase subunit beta [Akkermansiaceae bacterium]|nr:ADP-forming succinate--CoA ligase subunit beta [Akkermansiaceae bacterium]MCF7732799.1 ADP-forming succinate--CoA ligase subunit beta [Akkermansiaceae bacterium]